MTFVDLVFFRRVSTATMVLVMTAFLVSAVVGAVRNEHPSGLTLALAGIAIVLGLVFAGMRSLRFAAVARDINTRGPLPVFLFVLFAGFIGGIGLQQTVLALQPTVSVIAEVSYCGTSGRTVKCSGEYTVDGVEHDGDMPVRSVPSDRKVEIKVLAADHDVVVSKSWFDIAFFRGGGIALIGLAIGYGVRWIRLARTATVELLGRVGSQVHSNGSNPVVN
ncbi:hypothetical protein [Lentzea terrae]|uniref:hypothetical protein n=1 Tax=Lentzea terrae TaxID=2200761 RepID=UPI00130049EE|nr:hypothetical protein [Lentzea terrae]